MAGGWPSASYDRWAETCDTLHAHAQVLGKLAVRLAAPEPQLQHAAYAGARTTSFRREMQSFGLSLIGLAILGLRLIR